MDNDTIDNLIFYTVLGVGYEVQTPHGKPVGTIRDGWNLFLNEGGCVPIKIDPGARGEDLIENTRQALRQHYSQLLETRTIADYYQSLTEGQ